MRFSYREISKGIFAPSINLEIWTGGRWVECDAYIDSGATYSIFHTDMAVILGLTYQKGRKIKDCIAKVWGEKINDQKQKIEPFEGL